MVSVQMIINLNLLSNLENLVRETHDKPGYYCILSRDYCGMTYILDHLVIMRTSTTNILKLLTSQDIIILVTMHNWTYCDMTEKVSYTDSMSSAVE